MRTEWEWGRAERLQTEGVSRRQGDGENGVSGKAVPREMGHISEGSHDMSNKQIPAFMRTASQRRGQPREPPEPSWGQTLPLALQGSQK